MANRDHAKYFLYAIGNQALKPHQAGVAEKVGANLALFEVGQRLAGF